ncbi:D-glycerate 3-kinase, chloroplastic [Tetrabaena socialis]|uniref:D-glycerate 3-kinase, chloroplastic n=1 Tax=Tetrabaena socialis TaxID=47790 RepID=A0A2J7ZTF4_9CHLO|nr:D-glycerate 3-kinase, chloroplastic [Tetrabaena socialis]|eukprot:PNH03549.1 D-glycerate 3-kinase, chloroplastic [Tetrabaena socialis]
MWTRHGAASKGSPRAFGRADHPHAIQPLQPAPSPASATASCPSPALLPLARPPSSTFLSSLGQASISAPTMCEPASSDLVEFVLAGPLLGSCGLTPESVRANAAEWERLGRQLALQLDFDHDHLDPVQRLRIYHYYLPVYWWVAQQLDSHRLQGNKTALVLGISAPQGCGKTTIVEQLELLFNWVGRPAASVSIDDFYLTHADQNALAAAHPDNRLLQMRGNAGTHDLALGTATISKLRQLTEPGQSATVPRYNKSAFGGRGDRADSATWPVVSGPLEVVFFEGWMSGFTPVAPEAAAAVEPALVTVNEILTSYRQAWDDLVDSWLVVRIGDPQWVFKWRLQAEERMKAGGKPGMSDEQIADFVSRFIPAYSAYLPGLYAAGPTTARPSRTLIIEVDQARSPIAQQPPPVL